MNRQKREAVVWLGMGLRAARVVLAFVLAGTAATGQDPPPQGVFTAEYLRNDTGDWPAFFVKAAFGTVRLYVPRGEATKGNAVQRPLKAGMHLSFQYRDLRREPEGFYSAAVLAINDPAAGRPQLQVLEPPLHWTPLAVGGAYIELSRCGACSYFNWRARTVAALSKAGLPAFPGRFNWDARTNQVTSVAKADRASDETGVLCGPFSNDDAIARTLGSLQSALSAELKSQNETATLEPGDMMAFRLGQMDARIYPLPSKARAAQMWESLKEIPPTAGNLFAAVSANDVPLVRRLLDSGAPADARNFAGLSAVAKAAMEGYAEVFQLLVKQGADLSYRRGDPTALLIAASTGCSAEIVRSVHARDPQANLKFNGMLGIETPLVGAVAGAGQRDCVSVIRFLLANGADPNQPTAAGTPMALAMKIPDEQRRRAVVAILKASGAR